MTGVIKTVVHAILFTMVHIKEPLLLIDGVVHVLAAVGFFSCYPSGSLKVQCHISIIKMY